MPPGTDFQIQVLVRNALVIESDPAGTISKIENKREFVRALWYAECPKKCFKRRYIVKGLLVLVEIFSFSKEFR